MTFWRLAVIRFGRTWALLVSTAAFFLAGLTMGDASTLTTNALAAGSRFETPSYITDSGKPGPTLFICGGAHGNEPAGAVAAENIRHWAITRGKLVVVPRANAVALKANQRLIRNLDTNLSNLNRNYPRSGRDEPARGELATAIWALVLKHKPDWVLDLHEGYDFNQINEKSVGSSVITLRNENGDVAAGLMLDAVNATINDDQFKFVRREIPVDGSLARAAGEHLHIPALTLETTSKQPLERRVHQHEIMVRRLLEQLEMIAAVPDATSVAGRAESSLRIALYKGPGTSGAGPQRLLHELDRPNKSLIAEVTAAQIRGDALTNYDVVIFAGGSGSKQAEALGETGRAKVQRFVEGGGGYVGICAGAYLATSGFPWSLKIINASTVSPKWQRGKGKVKLELTGTGSSILGKREGEFDVLYANGPIVARENAPDLPAFDTLAFFRTEMAENGSPAGVMSNSPAIFCSRYKQGRVMCISPHPEQTPGLEVFVPRAVDWVTAKTDSDRQE
jgi:predicted deacylase